jgi:hypothetical protein
MHTKLFLEGRRPSGSNKCGLEDNIKTDLKFIKSYEVDWIQLTQVGDLGADMNIVMNGGEFGNYLTVRFSGSSLRLNAEYCFEPTRTSGVGFGERRDDLTKPKFKPPTACNVTE